MNQEVQNPNKRPRVDSDSDSDSPTPKQAQTGSNSDESRVDSDSDLYTPKQAQTESNSYESRVDSVVSGFDPDKSRVDPVVSGFESGESRVDSGVSGFESCETRVDSAVSGFDPVVMKNSILEILDDPDATTDRDPDIPDLDSVIKSFEEEIMHPPPASVRAPAESQPDLGYLLEASDDELGLPPAVAEEETKREAVPSFDSYEFENELAGYDEAFWFGISGESGGGDEFVNVGGLFEYLDSSEILWRPETETLPAV